MKRDVDGVARSTAQQLRMAILRQLGWGAPLLVPILVPVLVPVSGCGSAPVGEDEGGVTTNPSTGFDSGDDMSTATSSATTAMSSSTDAGTDAGTDTEDDADTGVMKFDIDPVGDSPPTPSECWAQQFWDPLEIPMEFEGCSFADPGFEVAYIQYCVPKPETGECADICVDNWCTGMDSCLFGAVLELCGVFEIGDDCCVLAQGEQPPPVGRPFLVAGHGRLAIVAERGCADLDGLADLDPRAAHWLELARGEHASIAAFARFASTLLRIGAPADLVAATLAAAADEAHHTRLGLALASRFAGRSVSLGALDIASAMADQDQLERVVHAAVVEGCIDETLAAHEAAFLAANARDPEVVAALARIASDEARHAGLAWRFVAWAVDARPSLRSTVEAAFAEALAAGRARARSSISSAESLAWGCPSPALRRQLRAVGLDELVGPCAERLLSRRTGSAPAHV